MTVDKSYHVVTTVLVHATNAAKGVRTKYANTLVADFLFAAIAVKRNAASLARPVTKNVVDAALIKNVPNLVRSRVHLANNPANGVVLITHATIVVARDVIVLDVTLHALRGFLVATRVLVCVGKTVPLCAPFVMPKSFQQRLLQHQEALGIYNFLTVIISCKLK